MVDAEECSGPACGTKHHAIPPFILQTVARVARCGMQSFSRRSATRRRYWEPLVDDDVVVEVWMEEDARRRRLKLRPTPTAPQPKVSGSSTSDLLGYTISSSHVTTTL